jgi:hypothetical protein
MWKKACAMVGTEKIARKTFSKLVLIFKGKIKIATVFFCPFEFNGPFLDDIKYMRGPSIQIVYVYDIVLHSLILSVLSITELLTLDDEMWRFLIAWLSKNVSA